MHDSGRSAWGLSGALGCLLAVVPLLGSSRASEYTWQPVCHEGGFSQSVLFGIYADLGADERLFLLREKTSSGDGEARDARIWAFTASFDIREVASERKDRFFLLGSPSGSTNPAEQVIERWTRTTVPARVTGGEGEGQVVMDRTELYRGTELGPIAGMGADPDGRYLLLAVKEPARLVKLYPDGTSEQVATAGEIPHLGEVKYLYPRQHAVLGRTWVLEGGMDWTLLSDGDNDGRIDRFETIDLATWQTDYASSSDWTDDFLELE